MRDVDEMILLVLFGAFLFAVAKLQIYLSEKRNPLLGLILPVLSFLLSLGWFVLLTPASMEFSEEPVTDIIVSEEIISEETAVGGAQKIPAAGDPWEERDAGGHSGEGQLPDTEITEIEAGKDMQLISGVVTLTIGNIGTVILLLIYWSRRRKRSVNAQLRQMRLKEL